ncbi:hypothetical protein HAL_12900 [Haladaptatus sp. T7]|nr:hypothetical protein HAL_12900 [Haladaptatus sp. T7]
MRDEDGTRVGGLGDVLGHSVGDVHDVYALRRCDFELHIVASTVTDKTARKIEGTLSEYQEDSLVEF